MAKTLQITVELDAKGNLTAKSAEAGNALEKLGQKGKSAEGAMDKLGGAVKKLVLAYISLEAAKKVISFLSDSVKEAAAAEAAFKGLQGAVEANKKPVIETMQSYQAFAAQMAETTRVGDDEVIMLAKLGEAHGLTTIQIQKMIAVAADMRAKLDPQGSIQPFFDALIKGSQGAEGALNKVFPDSALKNMKDFNDQFEYLQKKFSGAAIADMDTYSGKVAQLTNKWNDMKEQIGNAIIPALLQLAKNIKPVIGDLTKWIGTNQKLISSTITEWVQKLTGFLTNLQDPVNMANVKIGILAIGVLAAASAFGVWGAAILGVIALLNLLSGQKVSTPPSYGQRVQEMQDQANKARNPVTDVLTGKVYKPTNIIPAKLPSGEPNPAFFGQGGLGAPQIPKMPSVPQINMEQFKIAGAPGGGGGGGGEDPLEKLLKWGENYVKEQESLAAKIDEHNLKVHDSLMAIKSIGPDFAEQVQAINLENILPDALQSSLDNSINTMERFDSFLQDWGLNLQQSFGIIGSQLGEVFSQVGGAAAGGSLNAKQAVLKFGGAILGAFGQILIAQGAASIAFGLFPPTNAYAIPIGIKQIAAGALLMATAGAMGAAAGGGGARGGAGGGGGTGGRGGGGTGISPGATPEAERGIEFNLTIQALDPSSIKWEELTENHIAPAFEKVIKMGGSKVSLAGA